MKFTPEVIAALETLKSAAENDFERHRVAVLERDLTEPPKVEVIDETHQKFDGFIYHQVKSGHFIYGMGLHRAIWQYYHGEIPEGYDVHHRNVKTRDNQIDNLICVTRAEHKRIHNELEAQHVVTCVYCGKKFKAKRPTVAKYCSKKCTNKQKNLDTQEIRTCAWCGKKFSVRRSKPQVTCSMKCCQALRAQSHREDRVCPTCGKVFNVPKSAKQRFCSISCGSKNSWHSKSENRGMFSD